MSSVAVAILNYNGAQYLNKFLPVLINFSGEAKIYVIDNASTDDSISTLQQYASVQVIHLDKNYGYAEGYNRGLAQINADYFILLNSDVEVTPNWIQPMLSFLEENREYVVCQPKILDWNIKDQFEYAGAAGGFIDYLGYPYCRGRIFTHLEKDDGQYDDPTDVLWASGACMMIRSEVFHELGGFDADFFAHMEEIDLCWRIYAENKKAICLPKSSVYHVGGGTLNYGSPNKTYLNFRNSLIVLCKNLSAADLFIVLPTRIVLDIIAGISMKSFKHLGAILRANFDFYRSIRHHLNKRKHPKRADVLLEGNKSILFLYFILRKKTFSKL
ncbi:MAG: glycosyltransferase family 2 protein [Bacteroidota bacterium]